ncbi:hypothetical protein Q3W71_25400 [Micromonospora sp. C28SCA-DRY-2]|uniref:hypothetical protein n=1 Tax=Micromonospora sp. C28SCA-DRY-2 TaxID=3059522 RepID=UPI002677003C|nr:hypothetical protein [Micromonospora sp. C28SCA-DRY-2]MDO3705007.1 hypothetical protein [Micromonospora sp. C28SCA-DRY-2]
MGSPAPPARRSSESAGAPRHELPPRRRTAARRTLGLLLVAAGLLTACTGTGPRTGDTVPVPSGVEVVRAPAVPPLYPEQRLGFLPGTYVMARPLTERGPATGRTYALNTPAQRHAIALADALGFDDAPIGFDGNPWTVTRGEATLEIWPDSGGRWRYLRQQQTNGEGPYDSGQRQALALTQPVLRAAGVDPALARFDGGQVVVEPRVAGHPTWGWQTKVQLDERGIGYATGWLGPARGDADRPLLDAGQAFARLQQEAAATPSSGQLCPAAHGAGTPPCARRNPSANVTGARFVYALDWGNDGHHPRLVPAWLFSREGTDEPVAFPA